jgi:multicomponent Na+:H+ antiporter subunit G
MRITIGFIIISIGLAFDVLGCLGLVRMRDVYTRLQAATKAVTLGTCSILLGTLVVVGFTASGMKSLLCLVFILLTAPVTAHAIARGAHKAGLKPWAGTVVDKYAEDEEKKN